jgi:multiple sugar transport system substrate-binding protein
MYSIPKKSKKKDQAWTLLQYVGGKDREGKYHTAKNWNLIKGLGFGYAQLANDPEIVESTNKWGDIKLMNQQASLAKTRENIKTPWYAEWELFHQAQLQEAVLKKATPRDALTASATRALALRKEWS